MECNEKLVNISKSRIKQEILAITNSQAMNEDD